MYVVVVSSCLKTFKREKKCFAKFHFNGAFDGEKISEILAEYGPPHRPVKGREYIVHLEVDRVQSGILQGRVGRLRDLEEVLEQF